jgi:protoporphyrin/coproporphyrin ferrochelatase
MRFRPEPPYHHGTPERTALLLVNLGSPDEPTSGATRRYLAEFLADPRVVEIPRLVWMAILHGIILRIRPAKSAAKYATIWTPEGSPLVAGTARLAKLLQGALGERGLPVTVRMAMRYGNPSVASALDALRAEGATRILVLPLYPQYAAATTGSVWDAVTAWGRQARHVPEFRFVHRYHDEPGYIDALAASVRYHWQREGRGRMLVMSFHGLPERRLHLGDPYHCECHKTARLMAAALGLKSDEYRVTFQSRFGKAKWLQPYTEPTLKEMAAGGLERVDVVCPGFPVDCLETLEEIAQEARDAFIAAGGREFHYVTCLNDGPEGVRALAGVAQRHLAGWPTPPAQPTADQQRQREIALAMGAKD